MYPVLLEDVSLGSFRYKGSTCVHYFVENSAGDEFEIGYREHNGPHLYQGDAPPLSQLFLDEHDHVVHGVEILRHNIASLLLLVYNGMRDTNTQMGPRAARSCSA